LYVGCVLGACWRHWSRKSMFRLLAMQVVIGHAAPLVCITHKPTFRLMRCCFQSFWVILGAFYMHFGCIWVAGGGILTRLDLCRFSAIQITTAQTFPVAYLAYTPTFWGYIYPFWVILSRFGCILGIFGGMWGPYCPPGPLCSSRGTPKQQQELCSALGRYITYLLWVHTAVRAHFGGLLGAFREPFACAFGHFATCLAPAHRWHWVAPTVRMSESFFCPRNPARPVDRYR
jgi:hypothetical protein